MKRRGVRWSQGRIRLPIKIVAIDSSSVEDCVQDVVVTYPEDDIVRRHFFGLGEHRPACFTHRVQQYQVKENIGSVLGSFGAGGIPDVKKAGAAHTKIVESCVREPGGCRQLINHVFQKLLGLLIRTGVLKLPQCRLYFTVHQLKRFLVRRRRNPRAGLQDVWLTEGARYPHLLCNEVGVVIHLEVVLETGILNAHSNAVTDCHQNGTRRPGICGVTAAGAGRRRAAS